MSHPAVCHWKIMGKSGEKTREFYGKLFDWEIKKWEGTDYGMVEGSGEGTIGGGLGGANEGEPLGLMVYIMVDDLDKYLAKAEALGGTKKLEPTPIPGIGHFALLTDPDGITVGLFTPGRQG